MTHTLVIFLSALMLIGGLVPKGAASETEKSSVRLPAVSGQFYPSDPAQLELAVRQYLEESMPVPMQDPVALLVPHAGYIYSGQISADAYRQVKDRNYDLFVLLGVNHTTAGFKGVSVADYDDFRTPLGDVPIDREITKALLAECADCSLDREVHLREHSIEVQLPFLQVLFPKAKIVPAIVYPPDLELCRRFGESLARVLKNKKALIIISSDLSHYPAAKDAARADRATLQLVASMDVTKIAAGMHDLAIPNLDTRACGEAAILSGLTAARGLGARSAVITGYANSGDTTLGDPERTVGYGAVTFVPGTSPSELEVLDRENAPQSALTLKKEEKSWLLRFARNSIRRYLTTQTLPLARNLPGRLRYRQGAFVTLKEDGRLRGCIGSILPEDELARTVGKMALYAALKDPRFQPVKPGEIDDLEIEISVLTPMQPIDSPDRIDVGQDGVLMIRDGASAVFLPQVATEENWDRRQLLERLCQKGGWQKDCWKGDVKLHVFQADVFNEKELPAAGNP